MGAVPSSVTSTAASPDATREELARQALRTWREARSLLFVCLGNVCRSPFVERLALALLKDRRQATSAGHYPVAGRRSPDLALAAAQRLGVDLASHRSRVLSRRMLEEAEAVFVFDEQNYRAVISQHPAASERTHLLGALCRDVPLQIADPYGGPASLYGDVYRQIGSALAAAEDADE